MTKPRIVLTGHDRFSRTASPDTDALEIHVNDQITLVGSPDALLAAAWNLAALVNGTNVRVVEHPNPEPNRGNAS